MIKGLGYVPDPVDERDYSFNLAKTVSPLMAVSSIDFEKQMTPIKDQGQVGSCVAFAIVAIKEFQERRQRRYKWFNFSERFVYDHIRLPGGGSYPREGLKVIQEHGVPRENYYPYTDKISDDAPRSYTPDRKTLRNASFYKAKDYVRLNSVDQIKQSLLLNGACVIGIDWQSQWFDAVGSDYPILSSNPSGSAGGHMIAIVGFDERGFKIRNSWGLSWGKGGYAYLPYQALERFGHDAWALMDLEYLRKEGIVE